MRAWLCFLACSVGYLAAAAPSTTRACGGTFCDGLSGPTGPMARSVPMTVDQSGENILFVEADGYIEAHVQIRYQGDPTRFAWVVPMPEVPEISVGSQPLFDALLAGSMPVYGIRTTQMFCNGKSSTSESTGGCGLATRSPETGGVAMHDEHSADMMDPIGKTVGSFDVTILQPNTSDEITQWLTDNQFQLPPRSLELLEPYVAAGSVFVAVKLTPGAGVKEIHPLVFRYHGTRASIPIQLTAVAATEDMRVRAFFLGQRRIVPTNYRHVVIDDVKLDWPTYASNYENVVARAVDATGDGLGFTTEYAGPSDVANNPLLPVTDSRWNADAFEGLTPSQALDELQRQGQLLCSNQTCYFSSSLVLGLLQHYIPAPEGSDENAFYACVECMQNKIDLSAWDAHAFATDYRERVIAPGAHAADLLANQPYLTRLLTFMSPDEMTADPVFHERGDLPDVPRERWAEEFVPCKGAPTLTLPDGREVITDNAFTWPASLATVPYAERVELVPLQGSIAVEASAKAKIDALVKDWNADPPMKSPSSSAAALANGRSSSTACRVSPFVYENCGWLSLGALGLLLRRRSLRRAQIAKS
ncbi:MAG: DUF2330 domain-containing protein [Polyangiales bacterium]